MNIGTLGAAQILMRNNTRMMRGGGGLGGGNEPEQDRAAIKWLLKVLAVMTGLVIAAWWFHLGPGFWYVEVEQQVLAKRMLQEEGSKGRVYNNCFLQVETSYVEQGNRWIQRDSTLWIQCNQQDYLNIEPGHTIKEKIVKPDLQGWSSAMTIVVVTLILFWTFTLASLLVHVME